MRNEISEITKKVCLNIKLERIKKNWSQEQFAEKSCLSINTIGRIERFEISPTIDTVAKIATALNIDFSKLTDISNI